MVFGIFGVMIWEKGGYDFKVKGVFDDNGCFMVVINWNFDFGDVWEWVENVFYFFEYLIYVY